MPGSGVRTSVSMCQVTPMSLPQDTVRVRGMQSSVETQTYKLEDTNNILNPISMVYPIYSNVPSAPLEHLREIWLTLRDLCQAQPIQSIELFHY